MLNNNWSIMCDHILWIRSSSLVANSTSRCVVVIGTQLTHWFPIVSLHCKGTTLCWQCLTSAKAENWNAKQKPKLFRVKPYEQWSTLTMINHQITIGFTMNHHPSTIHHQQPTNEWMEVGKHQLIIHPESAMHITMVISLAIDHHSMSHPLTILISR